MNTALYLRVSTEDQAREGVSLAMQEDRLRAYCAARDWTVAAVYRDEGYSGKDIDRPGIQALLEASGMKRTPRGAECQFDTVLVYKLDRLTRSVRDLADLLERFDRSGTALVSLTESLDATTATGRLLVHIIGSVAQWEREQIGERTSAALRHKRRNGEYTGGETPYGYSLDGSREKRLVPDQEEQRCIQVIQHLAKPAHTGNSLAQITATLNGLGYRTRSGKLWHHEQVRRIIREAAKS